VQVAEHRCHENIDPAQQVPLRDHVIEPKFVEKVRLLSILSSHHRRIILPSFNQQESSFSPSRKPFFDSIGQTETNDHVSGTSALDRTPEESANCRPGGLAPGAGISVPEKRPFSSRSRRRCYSSRYFFLGGVAIFMSEGADSATFGFSFFGFLASRLLRSEMALDVEGVVDCCMKGEIFALTRRS
jgi:hypothetical protein